MRTIFAELVGWAFSPGLICTYSCPELQDCSRGGQACHAEFQSPPIALVPCLEGPPGKVKCLKICIMMREVILESGPVL